MANVNVIFPLFGCPRPSKDMESVCYLGQFPQVRGKFDPKKAIALGVPKGPIFAKLTRGEDYIKPDGQVIKAEQLLGPPAPSPTFLVVDCPSESMIDTLLDASFGSKIEPSCSVIIHMTPADVFESPKYLAWVDSFDERIKQIVLNEDVCDDKVLYLGAAGNQVGRLIFTDVCAPCFRQYLY